MTHPLRRSFLSACLLGALAMTGCWSSSAPTTTSRTGGDSPAADEHEVSDDDEGLAIEGYWEDYPDVPKVSIMTEVDGLEIPRVTQSAETLDIKGPIPVDVGNEHAKQQPGEPTGGDWVIVRLNSEPKSLNPIVENSAVQSYICDYVHGGEIGGALVRRNPETLEYEPYMAEKWVVEDSVKLAADYPDHVRRIALDKGQPSKELEIEYQKATGKDEKDPVIQLRTTDANNRPAANTWVGLKPVGKIPGAPATGYHFWSNEQGIVEVSGLPTGTYRARVGVEIYGKAERGDDGSLTVTPASAENPLHELLKSRNEQSLKLAKGEWTDIQEQTVYTYYLRKDVTWSDGEPFTTKDLEFAYAVINNTDVDGDHLQVYYVDLVEAKPLDPYVIRMKYRQQYFLAFEFTAGLPVYTPPWHVFERFFREEGKTLTMERLTEEQEQVQNKVSVHGLQFARFFNSDPRYNNKPLGTGPYVVDKWIRSDRVELRRNENFWNPDRAGYLDRIIFKFIPENVTALTALQSGEIDFLYRLGAEQYFEDLAGPPDWFRNRYVKAAWFTPGFSYVGWNMLQPKFQDRRVRLALALLMDRKEFLEKKLHNAYMLVSGSQYYFGPGYDHEVKPIGYDPTTAIDLLADAGWVDTDNDGVLDRNGERFEFEFLLPPGSQTATDFATILQSNLKQAGILMNIRTYEWASFIDKLKERNFDACTLSWASPIESDPFQIWHGSEAGRDKRGSNHVSFNDPLANQLIEQMRVTLDPEKRQRIQYSFHRVLDREQPYMFLWTPKDFGAYHQRFRGVKWYRVRPGFDLTEWYVPKNEQVH